MKTFIYIAISVAILFFANFFYIKTGLYTDDIEKCSADLLYDLDSFATKKNIIYFGESSNFTASEKDHSKKSISEILSDLDPRYKILTVTKGAIHAGTYRKLIHRVDNNSTIKVIVITLNLRSFGINWIESNLETNLSRANVLYSNYPPLVKKIQLSFKVYDNIDLFKRKERIKFHYKNDKIKLVSGKFESIRDWDKEVFNKGILNGNGKKDPEKTNLACHFIKNYAFTLDTKNERVKDFDDIVSYCKQKNIKLIFNLLPENYEKAREFFGLDLETLMRTNVAFLKSRYEKNTIFIDNFSLLKDSCFIDRAWPTEHYIYYGRKLVAEKIDFQLKKIYEN